MTARLPWSFDQAVAASEDAHAEQEQVAENVKAAYKDCAQKERLYRVALAQEMLRLKQAGMAITACETVAKGDERIARLREERDIAEGVKRAAEHAAWCANADRRDVETLIDWSKRRELSDGHQSGELGKPRVIYGGGERREAAA